MRSLTPAFVLSAVTLLHAPIAAADLLPAHSKVLHASVTFTMEDKGHVVAYPSDCATKAVDLDLNPQLKFYPNYDVIDTAKPREPYKFCGSATSIYVLDEVAFPKTKGPEEASWRRSEWRIALLDAVPINERDAFFASKPNIQVTGYKMPDFAVIRDDNPLATVREQVTISGGKATKAAITYVYTDSTEETLAYTVGKRPQPTRKEARDWMPGLVDGAAAPAATAAASASAASSSAASSSAGSAPAAATPGAQASSCSGCSAPSSAPARGFFLASLAALALAMLRRRR